MSDRRQKVRISKELHPHSIKCNVVLWWHARADKLMQVKVFLTEKFQFFMLIWFYKFPINTIFIINLFHKRKYFEKSEKVINIWKKLACIGWPFFTNFIQDFSFLLYFFRQKIPMCASSWPKATNSEKVQPCLISEFELIDIEISPHLLCCTLFYCWPGHNRAKTLMKSHLNIYALWFQPQYTYS